MKSISSIFIFIFLVFVFKTTNAQNTCCNSTTIAPEVASGLHSSEVLIGSNTPGLSLNIAASADLPNVEFLITKKGTAAMFNDGSGPDTSGGGGDVIIGGDVDGVFKPSDLSRYGISLADNDTFELTAIGYDLAVMQNLTDSLLNGYALNGSSLDPCCNLFFFMAIGLGQPSVAGFCDSVNNAGIYNGSDVNNIGKVLDIIDAFSTGQASVESMLYTMEVINTNGSSISVDCGGTASTNFVSYGMNKSSRYGYVVNDPVAVHKLSNVSLFAMFPNPTSKNVQIHFTTQEQVELKINVYNTLGQISYNETLGNVEGDFSTLLPLGHFSTGIYSVELTDGHNSIIQKLIVR
ncbi:T9SS type A sorting domain-containing protein [Aureispira]|nr:T9SS type A sorting domain-containing protein [Aureispira sp.]